MNIKKSDLQNTLIIIPVYNCEDHLQELFRHIFSVSDRCNVLCINDGSQDNSLQIIEQNGIRCIDIDMNHGKGYALKTGFVYAQKNGFEYAITIDADLQHDPAFIPNLIKTQNVFNANLVIGFRKFNFKNMPCARVFSNRITSSIVSFVSDMKILDSQSGYRLYDLGYFDVREITTTLYQMETEILLKYLQKGAHVYHSEIPVIYKNEKSNIMPFRDIANFAKVVIKAIWSRF